MDKMLSAYSRLATVPAQTGEVKLCVVQDVRACNLGTPILAEEHAASATGARP
jgi:hypothetical protein